MTRATTAAAFALGCNAILFLTCQGRLNQHAHNAFGQFRINLQLVGLFGGHVENIFFARVVTCGAPAAALVSTDFGDDFLPPRDEFDQLPINLGKVASEVIQIHDFLISFR